MNIKEEEIVFMQHGGSVLYGTNTKDSDEDLRGVCILGDLSLYYGYLTKFEQKDSWDDHDDKVIYEFRKAIKLIADGNPNMIDLVFSDSKFHLKCEKEWDTIIENRDKFLSQKMKHTYTGYAFAQLRKLERANETDTWTDVDRRVGYKCKHAMHLVRLLRMGLEIFQDGKVNVWRSDADELLAIRQGEWSMKELQDYATKMQDDIELAAASSGLPHSPDHKFWDGLCVDIISTRVMSFQMPRG